MKQLFLQRSRVRILDVDAPLSGDNDVLIRVCYSFIGNPLRGESFFKAKQDFIKKYMQGAMHNTKELINSINTSGFMGTVALAREKFNQFTSIECSCSGEVVKVGVNVSNIQVGDFVACGGAPFANHADLVCAPKNLVVRVNNKSMLKYASITNIGAIALQGIRTAQLQIGEKVCIIGLGILGQLLAQLAREAGCIVFGIDKQDDRIEIAKELGFPYVFNARTSNILQEIDYATKFYGLDTCIIAASLNSADTFKQAVQMTRKKGKIVVVGDIDFAIDRSIFCAKEISLFIASIYGPGRYDEKYELEGIDYPYTYVRWTENRNMALFVELVEREKLRIDPLISLEFNINNVQEAYNALESEKVLGVIVKYDDSVDQKDAIEPTESLQHYTGTKITPYRPPQGYLNIGIIGAGGIPKRRLLPLLSTLKNIKIHSIVDVNPSTQLNMGAFYRAQRMTNDYRKLVFDPDINAVIIVTSNTDYMEQALTCLRQGKAVFLESPPRVSLSQLRKLGSFFHSSSHTKSLLCVDFHRSFSPFMLAIAQALSARKTPVVINYRINIGYFSIDLLNKSDKNRSSLIGEVSHIFDLFCFLTNSKPKIISVDTARNLSSSIPINDNFIITLKMEDGSVCSLIYSSLGHPMLGREYMELFFEGKTITMNDFLELNGYGLPLGLNRKVSVADKGREHLLQLFCNATFSFEIISPISFCRMKTAIKLGILADELIRAGGGRVPFI